MKLVRLSLLIPSHVHNYFIPKRGNKVSTLVPDVWNGYLQGS